MSLVLGLERDCREEGGDCYWQQRTCKVDSVDNAVNIFDETCESNRDRAHSQGNQTQEDQRK